MPLSEADISATPIDDGSFPPTTQPKDPNDRSYAPRSPQPKLVLFNPRSGETETIDLGPASSVMTLEDYRNLNRQTTRRGMLTGLIGGGLLTYLVKRFKPTPPSRNGLALTFLLVSSSFISYSTSRALLLSYILQVRSKARSQALANGELQDPATPGSADVTFDSFSTGDSPATLPSSESGSFDTPNPTSQLPGRWRPPHQQGQQVNSNVGEELARARQGSSPNRAQWSQGRRMDGGPRGEGEMMNDPYGSPEQMRDPYAFTGSSRI
ncbi:hypothetical protein I314_05414 [Cryptococcus bacillisporus CA1873]|uniref:Uncharacterized protein n=2 Tax=Cryptococcus gattii TaxID=552467 RepID=A0A0D0VZ08_CRYGA|nr:hypothetical protein I312_00571 [Cryptococcus bacillisporus CA1280]KIR58575.1 hypothetical protein I314_05414 [Cryptococcus bacillisporus CA1873]|eukprot:KIR58575.1 hypothetical protein I314_05414 [Cryptococcus gattii CA1873]